MATGPIRRSARRGIAASVLGWLAILVGLVLLAPSASAAPTATVDIKTLTPPVVSVDAGGTVTFVNHVDSYRTGITLPLVGGLSATVNTDVSVTFFGQKRNLKFNDKTSWTFPGTTPGTITYTYRIVPQPGLAANVANQVIDGVTKSLPPLPAPIPYAVETLVPLPTLPSTNLPQLPQVDVPAPTLPTHEAPPPAPPAPPDTTTTTTTTTGPTAQSIPGRQYTYDTGAGAPQMAPVDSSAAAAFDPSRFYLPGQRTGTPDGFSRSGGGAGSGGVAGTYDGASVPVFGQLAGLDGSNLDQASADSAVAAPPAGSSPALPVPALAAVVALAAVTAALVRTHQAHRAAQRSR
jgi:hypothetical protein